MMKRLAILCLLVLPCLARAENFDYWWPWIYRNVRLSGTNSTNAVVWISLNSNTVDYVKSHTNLWDAALTNGYLSASNAWALIKIGNVFHLRYATNSIESDPVFANWAATSGWATVSITNDFATTSWVDTVYYPRSNPSNWVTQTVTNGLPTTAITNGLWQYEPGTSWVDTTYYPRNNPSNWVTESITNGLASTNWVVAQGYVTEAITNGLWRLEDGTNWVANIWWPSIDASAIAATDIANWDTAWGWGEHAGLYDLVGSAAAASNGVIAQLVSSNWVTQTVTNGLPTTADITAATSGVYSAAANGWVAGDAAVSNWTAGVYYPLTNPTNYMPGLVSNETWILTNTMSTAEIQSVLDSRPLNLNGKTLYFHFGSGTYLLTNALTIPSYYNGVLYVRPIVNSYGLSSNQAVTLDTTNISARVLGTSKALAAETYIQNFKLKSTASGTGPVLNVPNANFVWVHSCYIWGGSTTAGTFGVMPYDGCGGIVKVTVTYFARLNYAVASHGGAYVLQSDCVRDPARTTPSVGSWSWSSSILFGAPAAGVLGTTATQRGGSGQISMDTGAWAP